MRKGNKSCRYFRMSLDLNDYQFKTSRYSNRPTYMNPMVTTNQRPIMDAQKLKKKRNTSILLEIIIKLQGKKQKEGMNREELHKQPENK